MPNSPARMPVDDPGGADRRDEQEQFANEFALEFGEERRHCEPVSVSASGRAFMTPASGRRVWPEARGC